MFQLLSRSGKSVGCKVSRRLMGSATNAMDQYDIVVSGGGAVATSFVANLCKTLLPNSKSTDLKADKTTFPIRILLVENRSEEAIRNLKNVFTTKVPDLRVFALSEHSMKFLKSIDSWNKELEERSHPYNKVVVYEKSSPSMVSFEASEADRVELGRIAEDAAIQASLYETVFSLRERGVDLTFGSSVVDFTSLNPQTNLIDVSIKDSKSEAVRKIQTKLLVGADGANSIVRRLANITSRANVYAQEAVVASVLMELPSSSSSSSVSDNQAGKVHSPRHASDNNIAFQRYLPTGPLALLPCFDSYSSIVWSLPMSEAKRVLKLSPEDFVEELNQAFQSPSLPYPTPLSSFSSSSSSSCPSPSFPFPMPFSRSSSSNSPLSMIAETGRQVLSTLGGSSANWIQKEMSSLASTLDSSLSLWMNQASTSSTSLRPYKIVGLGGPRAGFPLQRSHVTSYVKPGIALIGDAGHSIHPQAGQGLNLGLEDAEDLATIVSQALQCGQSISSMAVLQQHHQRRYLRNEGMLKLVDVIHHSFVDHCEGPLGTHGPALRSRFRALTMTALQSQPRLKATMARYALGDWNSLPSFLSKNQQ